MRENAGERDALIKTLMELCDSGGWLNAYVEHAADHLLGDGWTRPTSSAGVGTWHDEADRLAVWGTLDPPDACMCRDCNFPPGVGPTPVAEVWILETALDHEPGWIEGVYASPEKAKAAKPGATWALGDDGRCWYQTGVRPLAPILTITPYPLDPSAGVWTEAGDE